MQTEHKALENARDALLAVIEAYEDLGHPLPPVLERVALDSATPFWIEAAVAA